MLFEFHFCDVCGGDVDDHEVCLVPGIETYFARCKRSVDEVVRDGEPHEEGDRA